MKDCQLFSGFFYTLKYYRKLFSCHSIHMTEWTSDNVCHVTYFLHLFIYVHVLVMVKHIIWILYKISMKFFLWYWWCQAREEWHVTKERGFMMWVLHHCMFDYSRIIMSWLARQFTYKNAMLRDKHRFTLYSYYLECDHIIGSKFWVANEKACIYICMQNFVMQSTPFI